MIPRSLPGIAALAMIGLVPTAGPAQAKSLNIDAFVQQWGTDHDGTLSLDEIKKADSARFDALNRNHNGTLDRRQLGATVAAREFRQADTDKDRTLDKNEYLAVVEKLFQADRKELNSPAGRAVLRLFGTRQGPLL